MKKLGTSILLAATWIILAPRLASPAVLEQCPPGHGAFGTSAESPDGQFVICAVDAEIPGKYELYSVANRYGRPVRISPELAIDRDVIAFAISPDSGRVAFTVDRTTWTKYDLYSVSVTGGPATKLNGPLPMEHDVDDFAWSFDSARVLYRQGRNTTGYWHLYSTPAEGGSPIRLSPEMEIGGAVQRGFQTLEGGRVRFLANLTGGYDFAWYLAPVTGGWIQLELFRDDFESGSAAAWQ